MKEYENNGWILTDDDSQQWVKKINEDIYSLIEMSLVNPETKQFVVYVNDVDVDSYLEQCYGETEDILKSYGYGDDGINPIDDVINKYPDASQIIAECIFEYYGNFEAEEMFIDTNQECTNFIHNYISNH